MHRGLVIRVLLVAWIVHWHEVARAASRHLPAAGQPQAQTRHVEKPHCALEYIHTRRSVEAADPAVSLNVSPSGALHTNGAWVTVTWHGVQQPQADDWIALYVPGNADITQTAPSKFQYASVAATHMRAGNGTLRFKLLNYRHDMRFAFMRGGLETPVWVASSQLLWFSNPNEPLQAHLVLSGQPGQMSVQWVSWNASQPQVQWGMRPDALVSTSAGSSTTLTREDMCGGAAKTVGWVDLGLVHNAIIDGLIPSRKYYYRFGDPVWGWSDVRSFLSPPTPGSGYCHQHAMRPAPPSSLSGTQVVTLPPQSAFRAAYAQAVPTGAAPGMPVAVDAAVGARGQAGLLTVSKSYAAGQDDQAYIAPGTAESAASQSGAADRNSAAALLMATGRGPAAPPLVAAGRNAAAGAAAGDLIVRSLASSGRTADQQLQVVRAQGRDDTEGRGQVCGDGDETVRVLLVADMGQAEEDGSNSLQEAMYQSLKTVSWLQSEGSSFSLLLHCGDLSYARGYQTQWDTFMQQVETLASRMPYMVLPGNHERDWPGTGDRFDSTPDSAGECGKSYSTRPGLFMHSWAYMDSCVCAYKAGADDMWYSFDHGPIHFLTYSTEHATAPGSPQHDFIQADLASVNRSVTPWVVLAGHRPMYISSTNNDAVDGDQVVAAQLRADLEPLLLQYKVDITLHGHHHTYQRTCPMANGSCVGYDSNGIAQGPVHLVIGHAGAGLSMNLQQPTPDFIERLIVWWGYARMEASRTRLHVDIICDLDGGVVDSLTLHK